MFDSKGVSVDITSQLDLVVEKEQGYLPAAAARELGVSRQSLLNYARRKGLQRVAHGIYKEPSAWDDPLYVLQLRFPKAIASQETAAFLNGMIDREPLAFSITMPAGTGSLSGCRGDVRIHRAKRDHFELGLSRAETSFGHIVRCYDRERTLCDLIRRRASMDAQDLLAAVRSYFGGKNADTVRLMRYARILSVEKPMTIYAEVLL